MITSRARFWRRCNRSGYTSCGHASRRRFREESVSQEDPIKIIIEKAEPREPDEPFEDQAQTLRERHASRIKESYPDRGSLSCSLRCRWVLSRHFEAFSRTLHHGAKYAVVMDEASACTGGVIGGRCPKGLHGISIDDSATSSCEKLHASSYPEVPGLLEVLFAPEESEGKEASPEV